MKTETAKALSTLLLSQSAQLNDHLADYRASMTTSDFQEARIIIGNVMSSIFLEGLHPIFSEHPELTPLGLNIGKTDEA